MNSPEDKMEMNGDDYLEQHGESLSDKIETGLLQLVDIPERYKGKAVWIHKKNVRKFIKKLKEKDLYRSLINRFGKVKVYDCNTTELFDLIEEYYNEKIDKLAGEKLI